MDRIDFGLLLFSLSSGLLTSLFPDLLSPRPRVTLSPYLSTCLLLRIPHSELLCPLSPLSHIPICF
jgi:hypothetical protein